MHTVKLLLQFVVLMIATLLAVRAASTQTISFDQANPPYMYREDNEAQGLYPAIIGTAFQRMGVGVALQALPWPRAFYLAEKGTSGMGGLYMTAERLHRFDYSEPIYEELLVLFVLRGQEFSFTSLEDLTGKRIGVMRGWSYGEEFDLAVATGAFTVEPVVNDATNVRRLFLGRVDAIIVASGAWALFKDGLDPEKRLVPLPRPLARNKIYLCFPKSMGLTLLLERFNQEVRAMRSDGTWSRLIREHGLDEPVLDEDCPGPTRGR